MTLTIGSMFSGVGGLDLGISQVFDATPAWFCEFDDAPSRILAHHWPDVPNHRDVTTVDWSEVEPVDIICGGSPCQDLSAAGKRAGMTEGTRSNLWVSMREAIATIRPRLVVWENVQGALSATATSDSDMEPGQGPMGGGMGRGGHLRALGRVLGDLAEIGYDAQWTTVRASDVGAPHHRARVFLIAYPADAPLVRPQEGGFGSGEGPERPGDNGGVGSLSDDLTHLPTPTVADSDRERNNPAQARRNSPPLSATLAHFPTPNASDASGGGQHPDERVGHSSQLIDSVLGLAHLPTPRVSDANGGGTHGDGGPDLRTAITDLPHIPTPTSQAAKHGPCDDRGPGTRDDTNLWSVVGCIGNEDDAPHLPAPKASDGIMGRPRTSGRPIEKSTFLGTIVTVMGDQQEENLPHLPTPDTNPGGGGQLTAEERREQNRTVSVNNAVMGLDTEASAFGKYAPVVRRWEQITGMEAPAPTELNRNGKPRLNAAFAEWMMGLPAGWITDVPGVTRAQQLKAAGNGVVPAQAATALRHLLETP